MEAIDNKRMTYAEYLEFEKTSETKHEYVNGEVYAMAGGTRAHARLASSFVILVGPQLFNRPCAAYSSDLRVRIEATGRSTYPDVTVVCGAEITSTADEDCITNPTLLVEVLSPSTEASDRGDKWAHYQRLPSLREYVLVSSDQKRVEVFSRENDLGEWRYVETRVGTLALQSIGATLDLDALYREPLFAASGG